jgi:hypothetical protein
MGGGVGGGTLKVTLITILFWDIFFFNFPRVKQSMIKILINSEWRELKSN